jgi:hypothetical protein
MIYARIELWPGGSRTNMKVLGQARIANVADGTPTRGNYHYTLYGKKGTLLKHGMIKGFARKRGLAWDLLKLVLNDARS